MMPEKICLLGATGSVGASVLAVIRKYPERFSLHSFSAWFNMDKAVRLIEEFHPQNVLLASMTNENLPVLFPKVNFFFGEEGLVDLALLGEHDTVINAVTGAAGFLPSLAALKQGKKLVIANKEALVSGGRFLIDAERRYGGRIVPLDSEHLALFDLLRGKERGEINQLVLTASGGPFLNKDIDETTTIEEVLSHPTWKMGSHVTVNSANLTNKGLEVIEAMRLFEFPEDKIRVLIHPQSLVHGAVHAKGGHWHLLAAPRDMRYPALHAMFHPEYPTEEPFGTYDPTEEPLEFFEPDHKKFPMLNFIREVAKEDGLLPAVLCAANEVIVEKFLEGRVKFYKIPSLVQEIVEKFNNISNPEAEEILIADKKARIMALERITYEGSDLRL